ncbi:hypothetical protein LAZ67_10000620 [Cordylochernes scorpioides]|uniref:Uncharacterized protein n=1 Tax=Cordylochernes scorpioides TaxID=51811 RepID=A0ABY6KXZ5_9ARAC|nr:hypothetical protein LAZ67_10000620 [Cordylochernes scorpioides]
MGPAFALGKSQATTDGGSPSFPGNASKRWRSTVSRIVTGDEIWVHHSTPETKRQSMVWKKPEESAPKKAKVTISAGKVMAIVFWNCKGVFLVDYLPPNTTVNAAGQIINFDIYISLQCTVVPRHTSAPTYEFFEIRDDEQYGRSTSMICSVLKRKESIKSVTPAMGLTIISELRTSLHENMEKLMMVWVTEKQLQGDTLTQTIICEKARAIYRDLLKQTLQTSIDEASEVI